jgi:hypothetical protein
MKFHAILKYTLVFVLATSHGVFAAQRPLAPRKLESYQSIPEVFRDRWTHVYFAAQNGLLESLISVMPENMTKHQPYINHVDLNGRTPLHAAAMNGHVLVVHHLVQHGADPKQADTEGLTPLDHAVTNARSKNHLAVVQYLTVIKGVGLPGKNLTADEILDLAAANYWKHKSEAQGLTSLMRATIMGKTEMVAALLAAGEDPNDVTQKGVSALYFAVLIGHLDLVQTLVEHGANVLGSVEALMELALSEPLETLANLVFAEHIDCTQYKQYAEIAAYLEDVVKQQTAAANQASILEAQVAALSLASQAS